MTNTLPEPFTVNGRYEISERPLGEGSMGVIYKAYDVVTKRFVALKTIWADATPATIKLFEREWTVLARLSHPNIVDILDSGDWVFNGQRRPYFVMPLLPGRTLEELIKSSPERLTVERTIDIVSQACRGLQAAHDQNLVHRDIKPSNIFVMEDDTVKIIDFGVAQLADGQNPATSLKGTPVYMAPEQMEMKPATPLSDLFALATVCYETLTGRKPFARNSSAEVAEAVRTYVPPPASEINPAVNGMVSRTVHKAMAKQPWHRFATAREFGETLQRALRNEPIERFERSKILPRVDRVKKAYADGDHQFALEVLRELESEGHVDPDMSVLRIQIEQALSKKNVSHLLANARIRLEEEEFPLALNKIDDALALDPSNAEALKLKQEIEEKRNETQLSQWFRLVREHLDNNLFGQARQGLQEVLKIDSSNTEAREMLAAIDQTEQEIAKNREEKQRLYESAVEAYRHGEANTALTYLERALALARRTSKSSSPELDAQVQTFFESIRGERDTAMNAYQAGRTHLQNREFAEALAICEEYLTRHPGDPRFQSLKLEIEEAQRNQQTAAIAEVSRRVDAEADLDEKQKILQQAVAEHPDEPHFRSALKLVADRRDLVNNIVASARQYEERGQFGDALSQMEILRNIYPLYRGLNDEMARLQKRKDEQTLGESKTHWLEQIDTHLNMAEYDKALAVLPDALAAFPGDTDLEQRKTQAEQGLARNGEANELLKEGQARIASRDFEQGLTLLRKASRLDPRNRQGRAALLSGLVSHARDLMPTDWRAAEPLVKEALDLEPSDPVARSLLSLLDDNRKQSAINIILAGARNYQADGHLSDALQIIERGLVQYPNDHRLVQYYSTLRAVAGQAAQQQSTVRVVAAAAAAATVQESESEPAPAEEATKPKAENESAAKAEVEPAGTAPQNMFAAPNTDLPQRETGGEKTAADNGETPKFTALIAHPLKSAAAQKAARPPRVPAAARPAPQTLPARYQPPPRQHHRDPSVMEELSFRGPIWIFAAAAALILILAAGAYQLIRKPEGPTPDARTNRAGAKRVGDGGESSTGKSSAEPAAVALFPVTFEANIEGTRFSEGGQTLNATAQLAAGTHTVEAFHDGYLPESKTFSVDPSDAAGANVKFDLRPILPTLRITSAIAHGSILLDGKETLALQGGTVSKEDLPLGSHTVKVFDGKKQVFEFGFEAKANDMPGLTAPLSAQPMAGTVVASLLGSAKVYVTPEVRASATGAVAAVPAAGLALNGTASNPAHFLLDLGKGKGAQEQAVDGSVFPTLTLQLAEAPPVSSLSISANVSNCEVMLDGKPLNGGSLSSLALETGSHPVRLKCPGYAEQEKMAVVKNGVVTPRKLEFVMVPLPTTNTATAAVTPPPTAPTPVLRRAQFMLYGAQPETPVFQNQLRIGTVGADGTFAREIDPGTFTWEWRKPGFEPRKETRTAKAGESIRIDGAMTPAGGSLAMKVVPEGARISLRRESDNVNIAAENNSTVALPAGTYRILVHAPEYKDRSEQIVIAAGKTLNVNWDLEKMPALAMPVRYFEDGQDWQPVPNESGWWIHPGSGYSTLKAATGSVNIEFLRKKKSKKINILADCPNHNNCIVYAVDGHTLTAKVFVDGAVVDDQKAPHGMDNNASLHFIFEMTPDAIVVKTQAGTVLSQVARRNQRGKLAIQDDTPLNIN